MRKVSDLTMTHVLRALNGEDVHLYIYNGAEIAGDFEGQMQVVDENAYEIVLGGVQVVVAFQIDALQSIEINRGELEIGLASVQMAAPA